MSRKVTMPHIGSPEAFAAHFDVSRETIERLSRYADLVRLWQARINLVAPSTLDDLWHRHIADCAQLTEFVPADARVLVDLGSGGGFPGIVLGIMLAEREGFKTTLIESDQRKAAFLREAVRQLAIPVDILSMRIENRETQLKVGIADVVTARALAPLARLLGWVAPYLGPKSIALLMKGRDAEREIQDARVEWRFDVELQPSLTEAVARIVVVRSLTAVKEG
jgi:16S rRNA (guanine527-N7)-methyltransferase